MRKLILLLVFLIKTILGYANEPATLVPYRQGDLWGYCDIKGNLIIKPQYQSATFFFRKQAIVERSHIFYVINEHNKVITKKGYKSISLRFCHNEDTCYRADDNGKEIFIDFSGRMREFLCEPEEGTSGPEEPQNKLIIRTKIDGKRVSFFANDSAKRMYKSIDGCGRSPSYSNYYRVTLDTLVRLVYNDSEIIKQIFPIQFQSIYLLPDLKTNSLRRFSLYKNNLSAVFIDTLMVIDFKYKSIHNVYQYPYYPSNLFIVTTISGKMGYINVSGFEYFKD